MRAVVIAALGLIGCEYPLDLCARDHTCQLGGDGGPRGVCMTTTYAVCLEAASHSDLTWIQANVFATQCASSSCHNGSSTPAGQIDLRSGMAYGHLVGVASALEPTRTLVVAGDPKSSYLEVMLGIIAPEDATPPAPPPRSDVGYMPQDNPPLCCQKMGAIDRWIAGGAAP
jgi:hypothetical protein